MDHGRDASPVVYVEPVAPSRFGQHLLDHEGTYRDRPELDRMLDQLREGDVVTVWKLDRLARSTRNLLEIVESIRQAGARFQSISEP